MNRYERREAGRYTYFRRRLEAMGFETRKLSRTTWSASGHGVRALLFVRRRRRPRMRIEGWGRSFQVTTVTAAIEELRWIAHRREEIAA